MVFRGGILNAEANDDLSEKRGALRAEVLADAEYQVVDADRNLDGVSDAAIAVGRNLVQQPALFVEDLHPHTGSGPSVRGVENVGRELRHVTSAESSRGRQTAGGDR